MLPFQIKYNPNPFLIGEVFGFLLNKIVIANWSFKLNILY